jgi:hypothetical protein
MKAALAFLGLAFALLFEVRGDFPDEVVLFLGMRGISKH